MKYNKAIYKTLLKRGLLNSFNRVYSTAGYGVTFKGLPIVYLIRFYFKYRNETKGQSKKN